MEYIQLSLLWVAFCALHSALISLTVTGFMKKRLKARYRWYRLFYNFFSALTLAPVLLYTWGLKGEYFFTWGGYLEVIRYAMIICAALLIILSLGEYDWLQFIGIRQIVSENQQSGIGIGGTVKDSGILGVMRHPIYTSVFLLLWSGDLNITMLIVNLILSVYLVIGTILEERKLAVEFGRAYLEYKKKVPMFIGMRWIKRRG